VVDWPPLGDDRNKRGKVYDETQQVRIRKKNPLIERKPSERLDSDATVGAPATPNGIMSVDGLSLYEQLENTDQTDEIERAARELEAATEGVSPKAPMMLDDTKSMVIEERPRKVSKPKRAQPPQPAQPVQPPKPKQEDAPTDRLPRKRPVAFMDEEETLVATEPPKRVKDLEPQPYFSESDEQVPTLIPAKSEPAPVVVRRNVPKQVREEEEEVFELGVVPRKYLGAPGTHGAGAEVHRQLVDRIEREMPDVSAPALKMLRGELSANLLRALDELLSGRHDQRSTDSAISPKRSLEHLMGEKSYQALTPKDQARLLMPIAEDPRDVATIKAGIAILKTRVLERLPEHSRAKMLDLFGMLDPEARAILALLGARQLRQKSVLEDRDFKDVALPERLHQLVHGDAIPELLETHGVRRERIVKLVLSAIASPARLSFEEGSPGVISAIEFALADASPAEYTRLWSEIVSKSCTAELVGNARLELAARVDPEVSFTNQVTPLRIALDQLPELAHPRAKKPHPDFVMPGGHGIDADVVSRALTLVYGVGFTVAAGLENAMRHLERVARDPQRSPPVFVSMLYDRGERLFLFDHFEEDTVYLRAPHGRSAKRAGAFRADPKRAVVDPELGLESVALADFEEWAGVALVPRN
jgi:hypothetical protein